MSKKVDTLKPSTFETIDASVLEWVDRVLDIYATTNEGWKKVPVLWMTAERAYQLKHKKEARTQDSEALIFPMMTIERSSVTKTDVGKRPMPGNVFPEDDYRKGSITISRRINQNKTKNFANADRLKSSTNQLNFPTPKNEKIVYESYSIPMPTYYDVVYSINLRADYQQQMNEMMTPFMTHAGGINQIVVEKDGYTYEAFIEDSYDVSNNISSLAEEEKKYETTVKLRVLGFIVGSDKNQATPKKVIRENRVQVRFQREAVMIGDIEQWPVQPKTPEVARYYPASSPPSSEAGSGTTTGVPQTITGLQLWLDATDITNGGTQPSNGTAISTWSDKSGNGSHFTQSYAPYQPFVSSSHGDASNKDVVFFSMPSYAPHVNEYGGVTSSGSADRLGSSLSSSYPMTLFTVFASAEDPSTLGSQNRLFVQGSRMSTEHWSVGNDQGDVGFWDGGGRGGDLGNASYNAKQNTFYVTVATVSDHVQGTSSLYINGNLSGSYGGGYSDSSHGPGYLALGPLYPDKVDYNNWGTSGSIAEVILYNTVLNETDRTTITEYLFDKWGVVSGAA